MKARGAGRRRRSWAAILVTSTIDAPTIRVRSKRSRKRDCELGTREVKAVSVVSA